ncbi:hypothetical protein IG631_16313 [Alternaria alternata]|jgi:hypothetical protein|nr:hypothetical protein IG631_16313 [Alternaria alternata]
MSRLYGQISPVFLHETVHEEYVENLDGPKADFVAITHEDHPGREWDGIKPTHVFLKA